MNWSPLLATAGLVSLVSVTLADANVSFDGQPVRSDQFRMVRVEYDSIGGNGEAWYYYEGRLWQRWETDFPRAELNFLFRLSELTSLVPDGQPLSLRLSDPQIFDYPFVFMSDVGWQRLSATERKALRSYLERGGFLWIDDFWGRAEWRNLAEMSEAAFPDWEWRELPEDHPMLNAVYPLERCPQVPARLFYETTGQLFDPPMVHRQPNGGEADLSVVHFMGLYDSKNHLVAVATHNTDIADGWEREGEDREYFERFSIHTYALGINILVYAFTH